MHRRSGISMRVRRNLTAAALCGLLLVSLRPLSAQASLRDLTGSVEDGQHEPLRGAVVYLEDGSTHAVVTYITDRSGHFSFKRLRGDIDYSVWAVFRGQQSKHRSLSEFDTHTAPVVLLTIKFD